MAEVKEDLWVYRVEDRTTGDGPYHNYNETDLRIELCDNHNDDNTHPGPWAEGWSELVWDLNDARFGFISPEQLVTWFKGYLTELEDADYLVRIYNIKDAERFISKHQCMFDMNESTLEDEMSISDLVKTYLV